MKMEQTVCSETSAHKIHTPGNYPEESIQHLEHGESLKSRRRTKFMSGRMVSNGSGRRTGEANGCSSWHDSVLHTEWLSKEFHTVCTCLSLPERCWFNSVYLIKMIIYNSLLHGYYNIINVRTGCQFQFAVYWELVTLRSQCEAGSVKRAVVYINCWLRPACCILGSHCSS